MGVINRPIKSTSGTDQYAGGTDILAEEVNADINPIYTLINGNIDNANVKANAGIVGSKLSINNFITNAHISPTADIDGAKLAEGISLLPFATASLTTQQTLGNEGAWTDVPSGPAPVITLPETNLYIVSVTMGTIQISGTADSPGHISLWVRHKYSPSGSADQFSGTPFLVGRIGDGISGTFNTPFTLISRELIATAVATTVRLQYYHLKGGIFTSGTVLLDPTITSAPTGYGTRTIIHGAWNR